MLRFLKIAGIVILVFAGLVAFIVAEENWRAKRAWDACRRELEAKGEKLDLKDFIPPPVPDDQNFAMTPLLRPLWETVKNSIGGTDPRDPAAVERVNHIDVHHLGPNRDVALPSSGNRERGKRSELEKWLPILEKDNPKRDREEGARAVMRAMEKFRSELTEISEAANRPYVRFPFFPDEKALVPEFRHNTLLIHIVPMLCLRATADLELGESSAALRDLTVVTRLQNGLRDEPYLISGLVRSTLQASLLQTIWNGLIDHQWKAEELVQLDALLAQFNLLHDYEQLVRGERAYSNHYITAFRAATWSERVRTVHATTAFIDGSDTTIATLFIVMPQAVLYRNQTVGARWIQDKALTAVDSSKERIFAQRVEKQTAQEKPKATPYNFISRMLPSIFSGFLQRTATSEIGIREARVACAIERFRFTHGHIPGSLDELVPEYLDAVPRDLFADELLQYRPAADDSYILYSIGWNEKDDGGVLGTKEGAPTQTDRKSGDWVWFSNAQN